MISKKSREIPPFIVMDILEKAQKKERRGEHIIHLEIGEPDFGTPEIVKKAAIKSINEGKTQYTHSLGIIELREAIAEHYNSKYKVNVSPEQIIITSGTSPAMLLLYGTLLDRGDKVIMSNPYYPCYPNFIKFCDGEPVFINVDEKNGFQFIPSEVKKVIDPGTKGIMINSPSNPTGNLISADNMQELSELGPYIISDEIYHGLVYKGKEHSILEFTEKAFVLNGFSKTYAMTGWRLGYLIAPKSFIRPLQKLQQNFFICPNAFVQWAGITALKKTGKEIKIMRDTYNKRRIFLLDKLKKLGFQVNSEPNGAFYILANAKMFSSNSYEFALEILENANVAVAPGIDFGSNAEGFIRFSYANSLDNIKIGCERLKIFLKNRKKRGIK